jgi:hypothetical protein
LAVGGLVALSCGAGPHRILNNYAVTRSQAIQVVKAAQQALCATTENTEEQDCTK